ncbi:DUF4124 domain-containing protein [Stutzerimonas nosocomialis]|uniref:DUF4124 domain-containing protein n=1 Tax=Stutzerimonas nosocomialis TaxID=1056496 RepID=A0A5R9QCR8_9GAMM|nr:DUF4124 domain-containing protein [Stutzerimonas nosocomialis]TLX62919.1 DUF4124 domain-containing protein [Stutzerimonas nosocomialis]
MRFMILTGGLVLALSSGAMAGQVYKWVDAQGITHFSAQPPQGAPAEVVSTHVAPPRASEPSLPTPAPTSTPDQAALDRQVRQQVAAEDAERARYCTNMRTNLAQLKNNPRVRVEDGGEMRRLTEEERQARISETTKTISENCK